MNRRQLHRYLSEVTDDYEQRQYHLDMSDLGENHEPQRKEEEDEQDCKD